MNVALTIGITRLDPGWKLLLEMLGVAYRTVRFTGDLDPASYAAVIASGRLHDEEREQLEVYARNGGAVLDAGWFLPASNPAGFGSDRVRTLFPDPADPIARSIPLIDLYDTVVRPTNTRPGTIVEFRPLGKGLTGFLGFDAGALMADDRARLTRFPDPSGLGPAERVSLVSKGEIALIVRRALARLFHERGLPFVRKRNMPRGAAGLFLFRIDSDYGSRAQIDALYDVMRSTGTRATWFLHVEAHETWLDRFGEFDDQEIALHCYRHRTFSTFEENKANIAQGLGLLRRAGFDVRGFSAPNGIWNEALADAVDNAGFLYASEFALAYDALPFRPVLPMRSRVNRVFYDAVQIPIHPVSVANLARAGAGNGGIIDYYRYVAARRRSCDEPVAFYHHPTHERWVVVEKMIREGMNVTGVQSLTFAEYARWWRLRERVWFIASYSSGVLAMEMIDSDPSVELEVELPNGERRLIGAGGSVAVSDLPVIPPSNTSETPELSLSDVQRLRKRSLRLAYRSLSDTSIRLSR